MLTRPLYRGEVVWNRTRKRDAWGIKHQTGRVEAEWGAARDVGPADRRGAIVVTVPTARLRVLFVLVVLAHHRRHVIHFNITEQPTAAWTAQQIVDAFPDDSAPSYLLRDRDQVYGKPLRHRVKGMGIAEILTAPQSPWQNPFAERSIGSARRECLNHVLVLGNRHLRRILTSYFAYYHQARTHLALDKDAPELGPSSSPRQTRSWSFQKSAACTTATSARPRSSAPPGGPTIASARPSISSFRR
jgi:hypothetical protein